MHSLQAILFALSLSTAVLGASGNVAKHDWSQQLVQDFSFGVHLKRLPRSTDADSGDAGKDTKQAISGGPEKMIKEAEKEVMEVLDDLDKEQAEEKQKEEDQAKVADSSGGQGGANGEKTKQDTGKSEDRVMPTIIAFIVIIVFWIGVIAALAYASFYPKEPEAHNAQHA